MVTTKNYFLLILLIVFVGTGLTDGLYGASRSPKPVADGFFLSGVDGKLINAGGKEDSSKWFFELESDAVDGQGKIAAGEGVELLASRALEKIVADTKGRSVEYFRLWGRVTAYRGKNFIFPIYFLPLGRVEKSKSKISQESQQIESDLPINDPNDELTIPEEIVAKLRKRKILRTEQLEKGLELKQDYILADRIGFVHSSEQQMSFVLDGFGRSIGQVQFKLLPCQALEQAQQKQERELEQMRLKVSGIITRYEGENYLLLQRAIPVYSYGNFPR